MNLIAEHNKKYEFFHEITGIAMKVHRKYKPGLLESAYEAALKYLLELEGYEVERQVIELFAAKERFLDNIPLAELHKVLNDLYEHFKASHKEVVNEIKTKKILSDELMEKMKKIIGDFIKAR